MANLKPWEEASKSPAYLNASPEQQSQMRDQYKAAGGTIPEAAPAPKQEEQPGLIGDFAQGVSNAIQSGGANIAASAARGIGGLVEIGENLTGSQTSYGKRIQENSKNLLEERLSKIEDGIGKSAGQYAGVAADIGLTVANPAVAAAVIAARETGRAYADQTPEEGEEKSILDAGLVGGANFAAQKILPGMTSTASSTLGRVGQNVASNAVAGAKGGALVGAAEAQNKYGDDTTLANIIEGAVEEGAMGAAYGGAIGGVHGLISRPSPQVFDRTPDHVKTDIAAEDEAIRNAANADELREAYSKADNANTASALNLLDENGFRITDAVAMDSPAAQRILNTDQGRAEKAATILEDRSNVPGLNPLAAPNKRQGKANADNEHNQKQAVAMKDAMADYTKDNTKSLSDVLDNLDRELTSARASGDFTGSAMDIKNRTQADRDFIDAYKTFYNEANRFKARDGEDFNNFIEKATELQKLSDNVSPEMKTAIGGLKKLKGMPEGFNPIQDAFTLNNTAKLMSNQDRGWTSLTADGFKEAAPPVLIKNPLGAAKHVLNRFRSDRARSQREGQQAANSEAIRSLARSDMEVTRARAQADEARAAMEKEPEVDDIKFRTQNDPEIEPVREPSATTVTEEISSPQTSPLTARDLVAQKRALKEAQARRQEAEASKIQEEPTPEPEPQEPVTTARDLVAQRRAVSEARKRQEAEEASKAAESAPEEPAVQAEPLPTRAPKAPEVEAEPVKPATGIERLAAMSSAARQATKDRADRFARSLYTAGAKAKATAENFLSYKGDPKELMRRIRQEDQANNSERHAEMARNQLASQQGIAAAKSQRVRSSFADWVKERGLPSDIATKALRAEEKGIGGNVTSLDSLKRRSERLYQKQRDDEFNKMYEEALAENKRIDKADAPKLVDQKKELHSEINTLLDAEPLRPAQKDAMRKMMEDFVDGKFKASERAGREDALEVGQMKDIWDGFINTYNREVNMFNKANKNSQYEAAAKHLQARQERLDTLRNRAKARSDAKAAVETERQSLEAIAAQKSEMEKLMKDLPESVREAQEGRTLKQLAAHHEKNSPVPPERFRSIIERIHNAESDYIDRKRRLTEAEEDAREAKWNKMYEQAEEMNRKFDIDSRVQRDKKLKKAQEAENDRMAVQRQRDDIHKRLMRSMEDKGIPKEDAEIFAGSYMDNRYSLLEKPMTPTEHQNARSRIESDISKFAKDFEKMTPIEKDIAKATGDMDGKVEVDVDTSKAIEDAKKVDSELKKLQDEELEMEKVRSALPEDERSQASSDILESIKKQEDDFANKAEKAFIEGKDLQELASVAEVLDRVHGADKAGNNRRFVRALQTAAENKKQYGDNPVAWFSADDYSAIAKLGAASAGGNKSRALEKIFGSTAEQAKGKLLGRDDVAKIRRVIEENPDVKIPSYKTTTRQEYLQFLEKYNDEGELKVKRGSLSDKLERGKRQAKLRVRVRAKE